VTVTWAHNRTDRAVAASLPLILIECMADYKLNPGAAANAPPLSGGVNPLEHLLIELDHDPFFFGLPLWCSGRGWVIRLVNPGFCGFIATLRSVRILRSFCYQPAITLQHRLVE